MITFDAFLVFLGAALLPVIYLFIVSRWIEPECRQMPSEPAAQPAKPLPKRAPRQQAAVKLLTS